MGFNVIGWVQDYIININSLILNLNLRSNFAGNEAFLYLTTKETVTVYTDIFNYDEFSLVVDLGSALGLWLGLSALTIVDYTFEALTFIRSKFKKH